MRSIVSESGGNASLARESWKVWRSLNGHEGESRMTAKADLKPPLAVIPEGRVSIARWNPKGMRSSTGPQSMGATSTMNRSAKGGARSSPHYGGEGVLIHPPHQGVCGRHGTEEQCVTSGGLAESPGGTGVSGPISASEMASDVQSVVGRLSSTTSAAKTA